MKICQDQHDSQEKNEIHYICTANNNDIVKHLKQYAPYITFTPLIPSTDLNEITRLLIIEPLKIASYRYYICFIWKLFFMQKKINAKVLVIGGHGEKQIQNYRHPYTIGDFESFITSAYTVQYCDFAIDSEKEKSIQAFLEGHNQNSLIQKLNALEHSIENIQDTILGRISKQYSDALRDIYPTAREEWYEFRHRWERFEMIRAYLPFHKEFNIINKKIIQIDSYFDVMFPTPKSFTKLKIVERVKIIRMTIEEIDQYVRPKIYA